MNYNTKKIHFVSELVPLILSGQKTSTWRLFDDKDLRVGDWLDLLEAGNERVFGMAKIVQIIEKKMGKLTKEDKEGHEQYNNDRQMYDTFMRYYGKPVNDQTIVKIIKFVLLKQN